MARDAAEQAGAEAREAAIVTLALEGGYRFHVDLGESFDSLVMDEPPPLGEAGGPNASRILAAAVGNCLGASLLFCLRRSHIDVEGLRTEVQVTPERNAEGRLRIGSISVHLSPSLAPASPARVARCLEIFEDYCVVTASVRDGIDEQP